MLLGPHDDTWLARVAEKMSAKRAERGETLQVLWSGYGEIVRVHLDGAAQQTVVVKHVRPPTRTRDDAGHARKLRSYEVETAFYRSFAARTDASCRVATCHDAFERPRERFLVLEDLDAAGFHRRARSPRGQDLYACLAWLASFHARFLGQRPDGLWKIGTYWHLATRPAELAIAAKKDPSIEARARELDRKLAAAQFRTLLHGDAKPANFCFSARTGGAVAAVDFQYVGGGPGIVDVAYLLHGESAPKHALDFYFEALRSDLSADVDGEALEAEWRALYPIAVADFERFLAGWL